MNRFFGWVRVGIRDLRGDLRRFGVLIACLALGSSVIAAVGSVGTSLKLAVERDAVTLMGGDMEISRPDRDALPQEFAYMESLGQVAHVVDTNARAASEEESAFIDLLAVGDTYPLRGEVESPQLPAGDKPAGLLAAQDGVYGAIVDAVLFERLGIGVGDRFRIQRAEFEVRGTLSKLPDSAVRGFNLGVTVLISTEGIASIPDLRPPLPGLLTQHRYKILLDDPDYEQALANVAENLGLDEWNARSPQDAAGALVRYYDLFTSFLLIVGLSSLLVGGVGVSNGVTAYIGERQRSIATLRSLGATGARIMVHFFAQIAVLTFIGVGIGVALGAIASLLILPVLGQALGVNLPPNADIGALSIAAGFGVLAGFTFSYLPLVRARKISPALLFRSLGDATPQIGWRELFKAQVLVPLLVASAGIIWLAIITTNDVELVGFYAVGVVLSFLILRGSGWLLQKFLRLIPDQPGKTLRHALRQIYRPGSTAPIVIVSIGLGLAVLLIIALLDANLHKQLLGAVSRDAPTFVVTDLFEDEMQTIQEMAATEPGIVRFDVSPMLRGAVVGINGNDLPPLSEVPEEASFLLRGEIPMTWERDLPTGTTVVNGEWWDADYDGPPLISLRSTIRDDLGLAVGDTLQIRLFSQVVDVTIANFREYQWQSGINFMVTFSPGFIQGYPATFLGGIKAAEGTQKDVERQLVRAFPDVSFIPIGDTLNQVAEVLGQLGMAVTIVGGLAVINGLLVLSGTLAAGRKQREADAVVNKVLGATRIDVLRMFVLEYGLLGAFAAVIASIVGISAAWAITVNSLQIEFAPDPLLIIIVVTGAIVLTVAAGAATTWRALSTRPAQFLRTV